jgi:histidinol-phosphate aminotransferase
VPAAQPDRHAGLAASELAKMLWTMQLPFGLSNVSGVAVAASYDADDQLRRRIRLITNERRYLRRRMQAMGMYSTDSQAYFVYLPAADTVSTTIPTAASCAPEAAGAV